MLIHSLCFLLDHARRRIGGACGFVLVVCLAASDALGAQRILIGAVPGMTPPLDMTDSVNRGAAEQGLPRGISVDFVDAIAARLDIDPQWRFFPNRAEMIDALAHGEIDMATGATGADPHPGLALSRPYLPAKAVYVEAIAKQAPTHRLAYVDAQNSPARLSAAYPSLTPVAYPNVIGALLAVSLGDADAFVGDMFSAGYALSHFDLPNLTATGLAPVDEGGYSFAFAADNARADALRERVNEALAALPPSFPLVEHARWHPGVSAVARMAPLPLTPEEAAWVRAHPVVHYSILAQAAPVMFRDSRGQPAGIGVDILGAIARMTGLRFEARVHTSEARMYGDLKSGASSIVPYSFGGLSPVPGAEATVSVGEGILAIVTAAGRPRLRDTAALAGKRVALPEGSPLRDVVREGVGNAAAVRFVATRPFDGQFSAVANGEADATVVDMAFANYAAGNLYRDVLVVSGVVSTQPVPHGMLVTSNEPVLLGIMNRAIRRLGPAERETIRSRWKLSEHPEMLWERRRPQVEIGALLGVALMLALAGWGLTLRAQIARRIAAENAMRAAKEEAETANRAKSTFLATMSHEIRTPMNAVLGLIEMELRAPGERAATERSLSTAHRAARDLLGMIDDLLDVAKIEAERLVLAPAPLDIEPWVAGVAAIYEPAARAKGVMLVVKRVGDDGHAWILADGQRLRQIVGNLLSNAIKFTDRGAVTLEYGVAPPHEGKRAVTLAVSDTGIGISPDKQALLFTPFVQAHDGRARSVGGTGLGLTISKRLVTMMGGVIELSSEPGRGTRFTVRIEFAEAQAETSVEAGAEADIDADIDAAPVPADAPAGSLAGLAVLVVDDHPANRIVLDGQIRLLGGQPQLAVDGKSALARWRAEPRAFDVILTDCSMPEMSGEELTHAIRGDEARLAATDPTRHAVPIVGLTANAQPDAALRAVASGMTACLVKPLGLDALRDALVAATRGVRLSSAARKPDAEACDAGEPAFDSALLGAFGGQAGALVDTLRAANAQDLADAHAAFDDCDHARLRDIGHRMKGAAAVIGAAPFVRACVALQADCERAVDEDRNGEDDARIAASFASFVAAARALEAALDAALVSRVA
ncbi:ATP-binding protein [Caballeronia cordobensis]|uniref:ATP-binding protein n=1 Tax=Caballeronia cordobensis TaxID=1353886 RepID=UPI00045F0200|nr:Hpt sensor hybrid histidine kinase [Burkholderia sp. RPE67]